MNVLFLSWSEEDPFGALEESRTNPTPVDLPARLIDTNPDGTGVLRVEWQGSRTVFANVQEGSEPGTWRHQSGLPASAVEQLRTDFAALLQDLDPNVRSAAAAVRAALTGNDVGSTANQLRLAALNTALTGQTRAMAITLLGLILVEIRSA
jgi:hypothetical protein